MQKYKVNEKGQAMPDKVCYIDKTAFEKCDHTEIRWLGGAGIMMNIRGTVLMIDPVLQGFDMPLLFEMPVRPEDILHLDALLVTHIDNDHFSRETIRAVLPVCDQFHSTQYVAGEMQSAGIPGTGHDIHDTFCIGDTSVTLTPAKHNWQNYYPEFQYRTWNENEYCGYWFDTPDGRIWLPGDSRLLEEHLHMNPPDIILLDFSDNEWHISLNGAIQLANTYPDAQLICIHWGTVDAPDMSPFNGNPGNLLKQIVNPERLQILLPGEVYCLPAKS